MALDFDISLKSDRTIWQATLLKNQMKLYCLHSALFDTAVVDQSTNELEEESIAFDKGDIQNVQCWSLDFSGFRNTALIYKSFPW